MTIAAIFLVPLVYLVNAFLIGRIIKRLKISSNSCFDTIIGFFLLFVIVYIISIWLYSSKVSVLIYAIVFGVIQGFLIVGYITNWRYLFLNLHFDWKKVLFFLLGTGLTILIAFACFREYNSGFGQYWIPTIQNINPDMKNVIWFGTKETDIISNFSANNLLNVFWINCFQIMPEDAVKFCNWSWTICAGAIVGCLVQWVTDDFQSIPRLIFSLAIILFGVVLTLAFIESYAVPDAWLMIILTAYLLVNLQTKFGSRFKLAFLTILMLSMLSVSSGAYFLVISLWLYTIYWAIRNKENSINYLICLSWPLMLSIFGLLSTFSFWLLPLMDALYLVLMIIVLSIFYKIGTPAWVTKLAMGISRHSGKIVYPALGVIIALVLVANFFIFHEIYHWDPSQIDYRNFLTFIYSYIWSFQITSGAAIAVTNAILYTFFVALIVAFIVIRTTKKSKIYPLTKNDSAIKLLVITAMLFCNPLVIHILKMSSQMNLNTINLNMFLAIPLFVFLLEINGNAKINPLQKWSYNWY